MTLAEIGQEFDKHWNTLPPADRAKQDYLSAHKMYLAGFLRASELSTKQLNEFLDEIESQRIERDLLT